MSTKPAVKKPDESGAPTPPKPPRAPRSDKGAQRMLPNAYEVIAKRQVWVSDRLAKLEPEYQELKTEFERNKTALDALIGTRP